MPEPMRLTTWTKDEGCRDDKCPAFIDTTDPDRLVIQGDLLTGEALADLGEVPGHEGAVVIRRSLLAAYLARGR